MRTEARVALSPRRSQRRLVGCLVGGLVRLAVLLLGVVITVVPAVHSFAFRHVSWRSPSPRRFLERGPTRQRTTTSRQCSDPAVERKSVLSSHAPRRDDGDTAGIGLTASGGASASGSSSLPLSFDNSDAPPPPRQFRRIDRVQRFARLPVWPAWNGVLMWVVQKLWGPDAAARLENAWTGRVCPNFFDDVERTSPFVMLVHHVHSFANYDLLRFFQSTFFPEGFPSHPHRGFVTLTYFLSGGFVHRDSTGCRQLYGVDPAASATAAPAAPAAPSAPDDRYHGRHSQWLHTGAGVLHEEMFDNFRKLPWEATRQELYQLWINVPALAKMTAPFTKLLGPDEAPLVAVRDDESGGVVSETIVLAGAYQGFQSSAPIASPLCVYHVRLFPRSRSDSPPPTTTLRKWPRWSVELPDSFQTAFLYMRCGEVFDAASTVNNADEHETRVPAHCTAFFESSGSAFRRGDRPTSQTIVLENRRPSEVADFMFLAGEPLREPVAAQGSMVMNSYEGISQAYSDYAAGTFGRPWDSKLPDDEWRTHVQTYPSQYRMDA